VETGPAAPVLGTVAADKELEDFDYLGNEAIILLFLLVLLLVKLFKVILRLTKAIECSLLGPFFFFADQLLFGLVALELGVLALLLVDLVHGHEKVDAVY
jgi:hypothetical protein